MVLWAIRPRPNRRYGYDGRIGLSGLALLAKPIVEADRDSIAKAILSMIYYQEIGGDFIIVSL